jgi:hypothetical protein
MQDFKPGIRFVFKRADVLQHKNAVLDGYHFAGKINDKVDIKNMVACICPLSIKQDLNDVPTHIRNKIIFINDNDNMNLWKWSEIAYNSIINICLYTCL